MNVVKKAIGNVFLLIYFMRLHILYLRRNMIENFKYLYSAVAFSLKTVQEIYDCVVRVNLHYFIKPLENCRAKKIRPDFLRSLEANSDSLEMFRLYLNVNLTTRNKQPSFTVKNLRAR